MFLTGAEMLSWGRMTELRAAVVVPYLKEADSQDRDFFGEGVFI